METTTLAVVEPQEAVSLLESPLSPAETAQLQSCELAIELAGKDRLEKALIIGEKLSTIYNQALFRGSGWRLHLGAVAKGAAAEVVAGGRRKVAGLGRRTPTALGGKKVAQGNRLPWRASFGCCSSGSP
jgi:hypothetical protein